MSFVVDLELMRAASCLDSDPPAAARHATNILAAVPNHPEALLLLAEACRRVGNSDRAVELLEELCGAVPKSAALLFEFGRALAGSRRSSEAASVLERAVEIEPTLTEAWRELGDLRFGLGDEIGGDAAYLRYGRLAKSSPELANARHALANGRADAADVMVRARLGQSPGDAEALQLAAMVAMVREDSDAAEQLLRTALLEAPGDAGARASLARLLYEQGRAVEALPLIERLLVTEPDSIDYLLLKSETIRMMGRIEESLEMLKTLSNRHADNPKIWLMYGHLRRAVGDQLGSILAYRRALELQPGYGEAYWALANLKTVPLDEHDVQLMQQQLKLSERLLDSNGTHLEFALGKALEDANRHAEAFEHYKRGNMRKRATLNYDASFATQFALRSANIFSVEFLAERRNWGSEREDPIFIVGMPRSGSTLIEQILASHPEVEGTRELPDLPSIVRELRSRVEPLDLPEYPERIARLTRDEIGTMAQIYLQSTQLQRSQGKPRFVDKMLGNFSHVGLIHLMFPKASIIDSRRLALACGFSCFKQLFARGMRFSYDLRELGLFYRDYLSHMAHIDTVLPGRVHRVHYEAMVNDADSEVRRLLTYCRLPFDAKCLRFYENARTVQTVSSEQVRRPIFREGLDLWRQYEEWLGPLREAIEISGTVHQKKGGPKPAS